MYGIAVSSGPAVMQFFILLAKTAFGKKDPSRYCGTVPLQGPVGGFSSGRGGGGELMRTHKPEQTLWVRVHATLGKFQI